MIIKSQSEKVVRRSKNLRGLLTHARHNAVSDVSLSRTGDGGGQYSIQFANGDYTLGEFASHSIMVAFFQRRGAFSPFIRGL